MNRTSTALPSASYRANVRKVTLLALLVLLAAVCYMVVAVNFGSQQLMLYSMKIRTPKLVVMLITAFAIGGASIVFQSIINNTIVTPCLLGMNSLYTLIHTAVVFFAGSGSLLARSANLSFAADVILMGIVATIIYSYLFQKTNHNVLYVLLIGTVLSSFFSSIQTTLTRVMDPNEYDSLLSTLVADFENINSEIIVFALVLLAGRPILAIFNNNPQVIEVGYTRLVLVFSAYVFCMLYEVISGYLRGFDISLVPALLTTIGVCGIRISWIAFVFPRSPSFNTIMYVYFISLSATALLLFLALLWFRPAKRAAEQR